MNKHVFSNQSIPDRAGVGLKPVHFEDILQNRPDVGWFEIHPENYMMDGGAMHHYLERIRADYPLSVHGVGLSLGSHDGIAKEHLKKLKRVIDRYQPGLVSEHLSWSRWQATSLNDLLPVPYSQECLQVFIENIDCAQSALGRKILIENPSTYIQLQGNEFTEAEFLVTVAKKSGAGILLDINNIFVSACNQGVEDAFMMAREYIDAIPPALVEEVHLAGHAIRQIENEAVRIDDHGSVVSSEVWELFIYSLEKMGHRPVLIEWDTNIPPFAELLAEAEKAERYLVSEVSHAV